MIAHCVRFQSEYEYLSETVTKELYGKILFAEFYRYTWFPNWSNTAWRSASSKTGSCLFDLNIHDIDIVESIFGMPEKISCKVQNLKHYYDRSESLFYYPDFKIKINGAWLDAEEPFNSGYYVAFEKGVLKFKNDTVIFTDNFGKKETVNILKKYDNRRNTLLYRYIIK